MFSLDAMVDQDLLVCPRCGSSVRPRDGEWHCAGASCAYADEPFPVVSGVPALVDFARSVLDADRLRAVEGASEVKRSRFAGPLRRLLHPSNTTATVNVERMVRLLRADGGDRNPRIAVVGGGTVGDGLESLYSGADLDLISFDVYASKAVQFVADAHSIPLADGSVDGVVVQAVLEHVLEPSLVASEIHRILRPGGIVYADTPFLQQVHEGPYDFTRFTDSGHRYLFRGFERLDSGTVAGAGTALRWSVDYFVRALTRSVALGRVASLCFFWLSHLDRHLDPRHSLDAASSVFFLGRKAENAISGADVIDYYQGGM